MSDALSVRQVERLLVGLLVLALPWYRVVALDVGPISLSVVDVVIIVGGFLHFVSILQRHALRKPPPLVVIGGGLLFFGALGSLAATHNVAVSSQALASLLLKVVMMWLIVDAIENMRDLQRMIVLYIVASVAIAIPAIWQQVTNVMGGMPLESVAGTFRARNEMVTYIVPGFLMALALMMTPRGSRYRAKVFGVAAVLCFSAVVLCRGRAGVFIAAVLGVLVLFLRSRQIGSRARVIGIVVGAGILLAAIGIGVAFLDGGAISKLVNRYSIESVVGEAENERGSTFTRLLVMDGLLRAWSKSPYIGIGFGTFKERSPDYIEMGLLGRNVDVIQPHNTYLGLLAEAGPFALGGLLLLVIQGVGVLRRYHSSSDSEQRLRIAVGMGFAAISLNLFTFDGLTRYVFWILLGLSLVVANRMKVQSHGAR